MCKQIRAAILLILLSAGFGHFASATAIADIVIPDSEFKSCILNAASTSNWQTINQVVSLNCANVSNLSGIEQFEELRDATFRGNTEANQKISDVTPLLGLTKLTRISFINNNVGDAGALLFKTNLNLNGTGGLTIAEDSITNDGVAALAQVRGLKALGVVKNQITTLPNALTTNTAITSLNISGNKLADPVAEINKLQSMTGLTSLSLNELELTSTTGINFPTNLQSLYLDNNAFNDLSAINAQLNALPFLRTFTLQNNQLGDWRNIGLSFSPQKTYPAHAIVSFSGADINDANLLKGLTVSSVFLGGTAIRDIKPLKNTTINSVTTIGSSLVSCESIEYIRANTTINLQVDPVCSLPQPNTYQLVEHFALPGVAITGVTLGEGAEKVAFFNFSNGVMQLEFDNPNFGQNSVWLDITFANEQTRSLRFLYYPPFTALDSVVVNDSTLQNCIQQAAQNLNISYVHQLLTLTCIGVQDVNGIEQLTSLEYLRLGGRLFTDMVLNQSLQPLQALPQLQTLILDNNKLSDALFATLNGLSLKGQGVLGLQGNQLTSQSLELIKQFKGIKELGIARNLITTMPDLAPMELTAISITSNPIQNPLEAVNSLKDQPLEVLIAQNIGLSTLKNVLLPHGLKQLTLDTNPVSSLGEIDNYQSLVNVSFRQSYLENISALFNNENLQIANLLDSPNISCEQIDNLTSKGVNVVYNICKLDKLSFRVVAEGNNTIINIALTQNVPGVQSITFSNGILTINPNSTAGEAVDLAITITLANSTYTTSWRIVLPEPTDKKRRRKLPFWMLLQDQWGQSH